MCKVKVVNLFFYFVHFADDNYSKIKTEDEQSGIELKSEIES